VVEFDLDSLSIDNFFGKWMLHGESPSGLAQVYHKVSCGIVSNETPHTSSSAFVTTPDNLSLVHVYLGPFSTSVTLASGTPSVISIGLRLIWTYQVIL
jgi:hypothetical protein